MQRIVATLLLLSLTGCELPERDSSRAETPADPCAAGSCELPPPKDGPMNARPATPTRPTLDTVQPATFETATFGLG